MRIRVATYNIRNGRGMDNLTDLNRTASTLLEIGADIICLQEVDSLMPRTRMKNQAKALANALGLHCVFANNLRHPLLFQFGNAILSNRPFHSTWNMFLPSIRERRGILRGELDLSCGASIFRLSTLR